MKKLKLIYNPNSGKKSFKYDLDSCISIFQNAGYETHVFKSISFGDIESHLSELDVDYDAIVISGGDGSINITVNAMMKNNLKIPLGIIPSGTANDFASFLKLPTESDSAAAVITDGHILSCDVGMVNDKYFINVCSAGLFTNISQSVDGVFKDFFGKLAYYIKGIEQLPKFYPMQMKITNSKEIIHENLFLYMVLNSSGTGGFTNLSPTAEINDGLLDFIGIKEMQMKDFAGLFIKLLKAEHLDDQNIIFFKDNKIRIENTGEVGEDSLFTETDIDGELGPRLPINISLVNKGIDIFVPNVS